MKKTMVVVPEKKSKIDRILKVYNKMEQSEVTAGKINSMAVNNTVLIAAINGAGFDNVVDIVVPEAEDQTIEESLNAVTGLLKCSSTVVENNIGEIAMSDDADLRVNTIESLVEKMSGAVKEETLGMKHAA